MKPPDNTGGYRPENVVEDLGLVASMKPPDNTGGYGESWAQICHRLDVPQ